MAKLLPFLLLLTAPFCGSVLNAQSVFPVTGFCIGAPSPEKVDDFANFIDNTLAPSGVNTLILRVDFEYEYKSRPELRGDHPLTREQVKKLVNICKNHNIELIPQINLLGHQSWHSNVTKLLEVYPQFDETPGVKMPEKYEWPNADGLYCKSYCPLHPEVHAVVFDLVDEIMEVFEAKSFHAGMDEVFYLADDHCPRCQGMDPATLFAGEVTKISNHLNANGARLWIWGDRLIDGNTSGIGMWEASMNNTARAIDMIPKTVVICDWHYERADPTPAYFALKGFDVIVCPWNQPTVARNQVEMLHHLKQNATAKMKKHYLGMMQTIWSTADRFLEEYNAPVVPGEKSQAACFKAMLTGIEEFGNEVPSH
ncbi:family 20 glycosylhydrolase [Flavobacteriaceae bacterium F89]|uniref:Family 20 glycosylhydrolase n=1 Tax=Cerina litoralis TaxID=2874477 RepID=A0AAE3EW79_9FLAO|nr:family 20 glycosylhydrolase [Cerina litoralis]MCG2462008.1 family 20 glycosylhydrolase [Cerina litoralis]